MSVAALLLASGHSRRFGTQNKLLALNNGLPLVSHAADAIRASKATHHVATVRDHQVRDLLGGFLCVNLPETAAQQADSLRLGVEACMDLPVDHILVVLADMPNITAGHLNAVIDRCTPMTPSATVFDGRAQPPACFPSSWFDTLLGLEGDRGAGSLMAALPNGQLVAATASLVKDIDTPQDL